MQSIIPKAADFINDICRDRAASEGTFRRDKKRRASPHTVFAQIFLQLLQLEIPRLYPVNLAEQEVYCKCDRRRQYEVHERNL